MDGTRWTDYGEDLASRLEDLNRRVQTGAYRATPSRRVKIPKPGDGTARWTSRTGRCLPACGQADAKGCNWRRSTAAGGGPSTDEMLLNLKSQ